MAAQIRVRAIAAGSGFDIGTAQPFCGALIGGSMKFLSDEWFAGYDELRQGVEIPAAYQGLRINIKATDGDGFEGCSIDGVLHKGFRDDAISTISTTEAIIFKAIILGDFVTTMPELFKGRIKISGNKNTLLPMATVKQTPSQVELSEKLKAVTEV